jgi:hypothetical protein
MREHKELQTLPRRSFFGKDIEALFSGKLSYTAIKGTVSSITVGSSSIGKDTGLQVSEISRVLRYRRF